MATQNIASFSNKFCVHDVNTTIALTTLKDACGHDATYNNFYAQGIPITIPDYNGKVSSISLKITMTPWQATDYGSQTYYIWISDTKYETTNSAIKYSSIKNNITQSFTSTSGTSTWTKTVNLTGLALTANKTYYIYIHFGTNTAGSLQILDKLEANITYYTVSYNNNGHGTAPNSQYQFEGNSLKLSSAISVDPTSGYIVYFNGNGGTCSESSIISEKQWIHNKWNTKSDGTGTSYNLGGIYSIKSDVTLYAIWNETIKSITLPTEDSVFRDNESTTYTITFDPNGGIVNPSSDTSTLTTSYTFKSWALNSVNGTSYKAGDSYTPSSNVTFYAIWNQSDSGPTPIELPTPTRDNYIFKGWSKSSDATNPDINTDKYTPSSNETLYAIWEEAIYYTISFNSNGGSGTITDIKVQAGKSFTLPQNRFTKAGSTISKTINFNPGKGATVTPESSEYSKTTEYTFKTWSAGSLYGTQYAPGDIFFPSKDITFYAIWNSTVSEDKVLIPQPKKDSLISSYTVTLNGNYIGANNSALVSNKTTSYSCPYWTSRYNKQYQVNSYYDFSSVAFPSITLTAHWEEDIITQNPVLLPKLSRVGYDFIGWATTESATSADIDTENYIPTEDIELYAVWKPKGFIYLYLNNKWVKALIYVYKDSKWNLAQPYLFTTDWKLIGN